MADYKAPIQEQSFVIHDLLNINQLTDIPDFAEATPDLLDAVIAEGGKFAAQVIAPSNYEGDVKHCRAKDGEVITPDSFKNAYNLFVESAWQSLAQDPNYGGQGLPFSLHMAVSEFWCSANMAFSICPNAKRWRH